MTTDQKRALGIGVVGVGGFLLWRRRQQGTSKSPTLTNTYAQQGASGSIAPYTPQSPIVLSPGESVYDPNSEALMNSPTSGVGTVGGQIVAPSGEQSLGTAQSNAPTAPTYVTNVNYPRNHVRRTTRRKAATRKVTTK